MTGHFAVADSSADGFNATSPIGGGINAAPRSTALSNRLTSVLSASYADSDIRDALATLDQRGVKNTAEKRRQLRLDIQKEVLDCNGEIVADFGKVAEVGKSAGVVLPRMRGPLGIPSLYIDWTVAIESNRLGDLKSPANMRRDAEAYHTRETRDRACP